MKVIVITVVSMQVSSPKKYHTRVITIAASTCVESAEIVDLFQFKMILPNLPLVGEVVNNELEEPQNALGREYIISSDSSDSSDPLKGSCSCLVNLSNLGSAFVWCNADNRGMIFSYGNQALRSSPTIDLASCLIQVTDVEADRHNVLFRNMEPTS